MQHIRCGFIFHINVFLLLFSVEKRTEGNDIALLHI